MRTGLRSLVIAAALLRATAVLAAGAGVARPIAIVHGTILDGRGGPPLRDGTIVVRGGVIAAVGPSAQAAVPREAQVIDARGKSILPGLADLHIHLSGGWDGTNADFLSYQRYLNALLYAGVTTVLDTGNNQPFILQLRQEVAAGRLLGPRIYCTGAMVDGPDPAWPDFAYAITSAAQIPDIVRRDKAAGVDLIKGYAGLTPRALQRLAGEASKAGLRVVVDQWERNGSPDVARAGISGFAHLPSRFMPAEDIEVLKERNIFLITTLATFESATHDRLADLAFLKDPLIADTTPPWPLEDLRAMAARPLSDKETQDRDGSRRELEEAKRNAKKLLDAGLLIAAGTDAAYPGVFQGESLHRELELLVQAGFSPLQAIRAATYDAARVMKATMSWGSLQPGLRADLLVVAGSPADRISDTRKIEIVMREGTILDRRALRFDPARGPNFRAVPGVFDE